MMPSESNELPPQGEASETCESPPEAPDSHTAEVEAVESPPIDGDLPDNAEGVPIVEPPQVPPNPPVRIPLVEVTTGDSGSSSGPWYEAKDTGPYGTPALPGSGGGAGRPPDDGGSRTGGPEDNGDDHGDEGGEDRETAETHKAEVLAKLENALDRVEVPNPVCYTQARDVNGRQTRLIVGNYTPENAEQIAEGVGRADHTLLPHDKRDSLDRQASERMYTNAIASGDEERSPIVEELFEEDEKAGIVTSIIASHLVGTDKKVSLFDTTNEDIDPLLSGAEEKAEEFKKAVKELAPLDTTSALAETAVDRAATAVVEQTDFIERQVEDFMGSPDAQAANEIAVFVDIDNLPAVNWIGSKPFEAADMVETANKMSTPFEQAVQAKTYGNDGFASRLVQGHLAAAYINECNPNSQGLTTAECERHASAIAKQLGINKCSLLLEQIKPVLQRQGIPPEQRRLELQEKIGDFLETHLVNEVEEVAEPVYELHEIIMEQETPKPTVVTDKRQVNGSEVTVILSDLTEDTHESISERLQKEQVDILLLRYRGGAHSHRREVETMLNLGVEKGLDPEVAYGILGSGSGSNHAHTQSICSKLIGTGAQIVLIDAGVEDDVFDGVRQTDEVYENYRQTIMSLPAAEKVVKAAIDLITSAAHSSLARSNLIERQVADQLRNLNPSQPKKVAIVIQDITNDAVARLGNPTDEGYERFATKIRDAGGPRERAIEAVKRSDIANVVAEAERFVVQQYLFYCSQHPETRLGELRRRTERLVAQLSQEECREILEKINTIALESPDTEVRLDEIQKLFVRRFRNRNQ